MARFLIITNKIEGGEWIATNRLLEAFKKTFPSPSYKFLILENHKESPKHFSFIYHMVKYFLHARTKTRTSLKTGDFDFILLSDYLWALAAISVKPKNTKLIFLFHGLRSTPFKRFSDVNYRQILIKVLERLSWILSDAITVPSNEAQMYILKNLRSLIIKPKIFLVPNIIPSSFFINNRSKQAGGCYNILYSGRLGKYKGLENLITAFSMLILKIPNSNLYVAYPASSANPVVYRVVKNLVKNYCLAGKIKFVKDLSEKELIKLYKKSDISILPSELEFAPLSVLESLATGTPVIGTNVGNIESLLQKLDPNLVLRDNSPDEICGKLAMFYKYGPFKKRVLKNKAIQLASNFIEDKASKEFKKVLNFLQNSTSH